MTIYELEERVQRIEHIIHGTPKEPGIMTLAVGIAEDLHGPNGDSGIKKIVNDTAQDVRDLKTERRIALLMLGLLGGLVGSVITALIAHFLK